MNEATPAAAEVHPTAASTPPPDAPAADPAAQPVQEALRQALQEVNSQEKADAVIDKLVTATAGQTTGEVAQSQPPALTPSEAAQKVQQAQENAPNGEKTEPVLSETGQILATPPSPGRETVAQAAQDVFNPAHQGAPTLQDEVQREYLRRAVLKRLKWFDAWDAQLFLSINHLPHTRWLNRFFYGLTWIFSGGAAWYGLMGLLTLRNPRSGWGMIRTSALPLTIATSLVEYPIKAYFRRRRPFIKVIQAVVIGQKPGSWSFPSGHSATAFAGAWLFSRHFPRVRGIFYLIATLVAFSRIYLGVHYPGDVVAGSLLGALFARLCARLPWWRTEPPNRQP